MKSLIRKFIRANNHLELVATVPEIREANSRIDALATLLNAQGWTVAHLDLALRNPAAVVATVDRASAQRVHADYIARIKREGSDLFLSVAPDEE